MGRKSGRKPGRPSTVPDGWISLCQLIKDARGTHDTWLAEDVCDMGGIPIARAGPTGTLAIRAEYRPKWEETLAEVWDARVSRRKRRKQRSDATADPPRRVKWRRAE